MGEAQRWFDDLPVIGRLPRAERAAALRALDPQPDAEPEAQTKGFFSSVPDPWEHTSHAFGFLPPAAPASGLVDVTPASQIQADPALQNARIAVKLDRLRVAAYPGRGVHRILFDFYARNQREGGEDDLHFNMVLRAQQGQSAAVVGYPIFVGLGVGAGGVGFRCHTVNVKNEQDEALLGILESDSMRRGLQLLSTVQPALGPLSTMAVGITRALAGRHRNVSVQDFYLGLDFGGSATGARLREGTYFAVQAPEEITASCWQQWAYNAQAQHLVARDDPAVPIAHNYIAFSVCRHPG
ncbi:hypothetical protein WMF18_15320 [Sorangium sp. So ce315]|uniref:hypothetical protein n=1 Tax=Sorangium sp. So ce315 TaxID=3133299 RepID=UPI003F62D818